MSPKNSGSFNAGFAQVKITPSETLPLAGISGKRIGREIRDDLFAKALVFELHDQRIVLVSLDLLWIGRDFCNTFRIWAKKTLDLAPSSILLAATHTHSAPQVREFTFDGCDRDPDYISFVQERTQAALLKAVSQLTPSLIKYGTGRTQIAINRRRRILDWEQIKRFRIKWKMANRPNFKGACDTNLGIIQVQSLDAKTPPITVVNAACHPSVFRGEMYSGDFPGLLAGELSKKKGAPVHTLFLQGFSGNLRSRQIIRLPLKYWPPSAVFAFFFDRIRFRKDRPNNHLKTVACTLSKDIENIRLEALNPTRLEFKEVEIRLPLQPPRTHAYFENILRSENPIQSSFGKFWLKAESIPEEIPLRLLSLSLSPTISFLGVEGEVFSEYSLWLRKLIGTRIVLPVGCCGGAVGYLPDRKGLLQGGYEPDRSIQMFGLPAGFSEIIELRLKEGIAELLSIPAVKSEESD